MCKCCEYWELAKGVVAQMFSLVMCLNEFESVMHWIACMSRGWPVSKMFVRAKPSQEGIMVLGKYIEVNVFVKLTFLLICALLPLSLVCRWSLPWNVLLLEKSLNGAYMVVTQSAILIGNFPLWPFVCRNPCSLLNPLELQPSKKTVRCLDYFLGLVCCKCRGALGTLLFFFFSWQVSAVQWGWDCQGQS